MIYFDIIASDRAVGSVVIRPLNLPGRQAWAYTIACGETQRGVLEDDGLLPLEGGESGVLSLIRAVLIDAGRQ